ncbi:MAG: hypothetical protein LBP26_04990 [Clostridiales bacterium]|nr:hypothetical protein [Clostridiales bacterium]
MPVTLTVGLKKSARLKIKLFKLIGFRPKREFDLDGYKSFLTSVGFDGCEFLLAEGKMPMAVAVWKKQVKTLC